MNGRKRRPARALAIMLSAILIVSSMGLTVFADEQIPADEKVIVEGSADQQQAEEDIVQTGKNEAMQLADEPADEPAEVPADEPTGEPDEVPADEPTGEPDEVSAEEPAGEPTEVSAEEPAKEPADEPAEEPAKEPDEVSAEEPTDEPADGGSAGDIAGETLPDAELSDAAMEEIDKAPLAEAVTNVTYIERSWDGEKVVKKETTRSEDISSFPKSANIPSGWYYLNENVTIDGRVSLAGDTWLILGDGKTLDVEGLYVPKGSTLTVYAQSDGKGAGSIISKPDDVGAGIGATSNNHPGGNVVIHGGNIEATGHDHCAGIGSNDGNGTTADITIYGGTVTATAGSNSAGIGGGRYCDGGSIKIYGGDVTATGKGNSAGIGGGDPGDGVNGNSGAILIMGGTVTSKGSGKGAGIGGSQKGSADIHIEGGVIDASSGSRGVGIGHGADGSSAGGEYPDIFLGWTSVSKDTISITSSSFMGTVKLRDSFLNDEHIFKAELVPDNSLLAKSALTAYDNMNVTGWAQLQKYINTTSGHEVFALASDIKANTEPGSDETYLNVPEGKDIEIGLNGHTIDRGLGDTNNWDGGSPFEVIGGGIILTEHGNVFRVESGARLTLFDAPGGGGKIIGGGAMDNGGGIYNKGTLSLQYVTVTGCVSDYGGGIYNEGEQSVLNIENSSITGNMCMLNGGGIYNNGGSVSIKDGTVMENRKYSSSSSKSGLGFGIYCAGGKLNVEGDTVVTDNTAKKSGAYINGNIVLAGSTVIDITGKLQDSAKMGVTLWDGKEDMSGVITSGLAGNGSAENFFSDDVGFMLVQNSDGEAELIARNEVKINGVSGSFNDRITVNYYFDIPENLLTDEGAYVLLYNEDTDDDPIILPVSGAEFVENKGYKFSIPVVAKEASDTITARMFDGEGNAVSIIGQTGENYIVTGVTFVLMDYYNWLEKNGRDDNEKALAKAVRDYCTAAQIYFEYNANDLSVSDAVTNMSEDLQRDLESYIAVRSGTLPAGVSIKGISAMLESDNTLRLYYGFKGVDPKNLTFMVDGEKVEQLKQRSDGMYYLDLKSIADSEDDEDVHGVYSNHMQDTHTYSVSDGTNTYKITASVLTYARACTKKDDEDVINLGRALYLYNRAAVKPFGE